MQIINSNLFNILISGLDNHILPAMS